MTTLLEIREVVKDYQGLRPLRVRDLRVTANRVVSLTGFDAAAAEVFVNLVMGAVLPDTGDVELFGTNTRHITDTEQWLRSLDGIGLVSHRAVLVGGLSVLGNVAMPLTLEVDPIAPALQAEAEALAREAGISETSWDQPLGRADEETLFRVRLARAVALKPTLLIAEHPSASLPRDAVARAAEAVLRVARDRQAALVTISADAEWTARLGGDVLALDPRTGALAPGGGFVERFKRAWGGR